VGKYIIKVIIAVLVLAAIAVIAGAWMVWKRPLTIDAWMSRSALKINGLEKHELDTESGRMTVWEGGSGPTLVLLHGAGDQAGAWARTIGGLVGDYRVVIPDLPGHGGSDPHSGPIHMEQLLDGLDRVMDAYCPDEPVIIVGNSMGAWLGFLYARDNPGRVERLVAVNGGPLVEPNPRVNLFPTTRDEARETMKGLMGPASPPIPGFVLDDVVRRMADGPAARFASTATELGAYVLEGRLDQIEVPVELVWGAADQLMTLDYANRMIDGLPRARLHPINGCGHVPQRECPLRFLEVLTGALAEAPPEPQPEVDEAPPENAVDEDQQAGSLLHNGAGLLWGVHVTLSGAASEAAESKGPHWLSGAFLAGNGLVLWGDSSTHSRTRSLRMTWFEGVVIPCVGVAPRRGGARDDLVFAAPVVPSLAGACRGRGAQDDMSCDVEPEKEIRA